MEMHQEVQLETKLEELLLTGSTFISWAQLYNWYRVAKITKTPWRDISRRWSLMCELREISPPLPLKVYGNASSGMGGVRLVRDYEEMFDHSQTTLEELAS
ncbi:hypothetical protein [Herbaspirillum frisingense]|uniref:Uncharacterized protein n=1 Tax=Herbaspirillum frisingense TaxID=92645 RepID=A0ABU1PCA1_9BURK|nr:hypothetical protein [Herbaspirillum frisingense]MDR6583552.1 hypothetical protein [Herbaspirillum frisingense]